MVAARNVNYNVSVVTKNAQDLTRLNRQLAGVSKSVKKVADQSKTASRDLGSLRRGFQGLIATIGIREITRAADRIQLLRDRIKVFSDSTEEANDTFRGITELARTTNSSIESIGTAFNRLTLSTRELGLSSRDVLQVTEALQNTFRISGSTIAEATGSTIQLAQGLSAGALRGQELRSVLEANGKLSELLAKEFQVARGQLIKLAETGAITSQRVFKVLNENFDELSKQASTLRITFGQVFTRVIDNISIKLDELNSRFNISANIANFADAFIANLDSIALTVGVLVASKTITSLAGQFLTLKKAIEGLASSKAIATLGAAFGKSGVLAGVGGLIASIIPSSTSNLSTIDDTAKRLKSLREELDELEKSRIKNAAAFQTRDVGFEEYAREATRIQSSVKRVNTEIKALTSFQKSLNVQTKKTAEGLSKFSREVEATQTIKDINNLFKEGAIDAEDYAKALREIRVADVNKRFEEGKITLEQYNQELDRLNQRTLTLNDGFRKGVDDFIRSSGTLAENIAQATSNVFRNLEDRLTEFVRRGKFEFKELTNAILDDLARIAVRQAIVRPLAGAIGGLFTPQTAGAGGLGGASSERSFPLPNANGNAFSGGNVIPFQNGGVVTSPTFFGMSGNRTGLMGEAGAEAILPLRRGSNGRLGVESSGGGTIVNVINNTSQEVQTNESQTGDGEKQIDIVIGSKVNSLLAKGQFDKTLNQSFGLRRQGR